MPICEYTLNFPKDKKAIELFSHFLYNQISRGEVLAPPLSIHIFIKEENQYEEVSCIAAVYDSGLEPIFGICLCGTGCCFLILCVFRSRRLAMI